MIWSLSPAVTVPFLSEFFLLLIWGFDLQIIKDFPFYLWFVPGQYLTYFSTAVFFLTGSTSLKEVRTLLSERQFRLFALRRKQSSYFLLRECLNVYIPEEIMELENLTALRFLLCFVYWKTFHPLGVDKKLFRDFFTLVVSSKIPGK